MKPQNEPVCSGVSPKKHTIFKLKRTVYQIAISGIRLLQAAERITNHDILGRGNYIGRKRNGSRVNNSPVCFVNLDSINVTPYFKIYEELLSTPYDLIYWDRVGSEEKNGARNTHRYFCPVRKTNSIDNLMDLAKGYLGFKRFASRFLIENHYDIVVALTGNAAVLLGKTLKTHYKKRYIMDIRDYFLEKIPMYHYAEQSVIDCSALALISSPAFTTFLGKHDFQIIHNMQTIGKSYIDAFRQRTHECRPFVIANIGTAKSLDLDRMTIDYFANDPRFEVRFIGRGFEALEEYRNVTKADNIIISGSFPSSETMKHYRDVDAILATYGSKRTHVKYALPNKLYFAAQLELPILASPGTYLAQVATKNHLGLALDINDPIGKEAILSLYQDNAINMRREGASSFLRQAQKDNQAALCKIANILSAIN